MRTGSCKFGPACKFHHPQPPSLTTALPAFGSTGSTVVPSSGVPYTGGLSAWSYPRAPYVAGPRIATPQPYMPAVVLSPPQGVLPAHGWNTYVVSVLFIFLIEQQFALRMNVPTSVQHLLRSLCFVCLSSSIIDCAQLDIFL